MAAIGFTQAARALRIDTPLGADALLLRSFSGQEAVSQLFRFQLELLSEHDDIDFDSIVGKNVTVHLQIIDSERSLNGFISRFAQGGRDGRFTRYHAEMVPWLWFLTRKADCRIFQRMTAPDIIKKIFDDLGFKDYVLRLYHNPYRTREYCVQYRESNFTFVTRLMEEEGICYFFEHDQAGAKHTLVLADETVAHKPCPGQPKARCDFSPNNWHPDDVVSDWRMEQEYRPSVWSHTDYNFETPSTSLMATVQDQASYEIYDYPGLYLIKGDGDQLAKTRLQGTLAFKQRVTGQSNCRCFTSGATVELTDHYRKEMNQKWMLTAVHHQSTMGEAYGSGGSDEGFFYRNTFECIPASVRFRPPRAIHKPRVRGCQTAVVVGPAGEEIYTDKYGRVKVQFHWDRIGNNNEDSSCWIRVSYPWAGQGWGAISVPRIGQEVVVDFLEGDPDRPLIIGRVYNAERMPPFGMPAGAVISGIKSNSTKAGGGFNEISLDDTKGKEKINIRAEHDLWGLMLHERREQIGDRTSLKVDGDAAAEYGRNHAERVSGERYLKAERVVIEAGAEISLQVGGNHVVINGGGVFIDGKVVDLNCGYAASGTTLGGLMPLLPVKDPDLVKAAGAAPALPPAAPPPMAPPVSQTLSRGLAMNAGAASRAATAIRLPEDQLRLMAIIRERPKGNSPEAIAAKAQELTDLKAAILSSPDLNAWRQGISPDAYRNPTNFGGTDPRDPYAGYVRLPRATPQDSWIETGVGGIFDRMADDGKVYTFKGLNSPAYNGSGYIALLNAIEDRYHYFTGKVMPDAGNWPQPLGAGIPPDNGVNLLSSRSNPGNQIPPIGSRPKNQIPLIGSRPKNFGDRIRQLTHEGHGPQRHEGQVTEEQLRARAVDGKDPVTGTTDDAYKKNPDGTPAKHQYGRDATKVNSEEAYVSAEDYLRSTDEFKTQAAEKGVNERIIIRRKLEEIYGPDYKNSVSGVTREGTKNNPTGSHPTDFTDGNMVAVWVRDATAWGSNGNWSLLTMYPEPKPTTP